jgi:hypothetical protein
VGTPGGFGAKPLKIGAEQNASGRYAAGGIGSCTEVTCGAVSVVRVTADPWSTRGVAGAQQSCFWAIPAQSWLMAAQQAISAGVRSSPNTHSADATIPNARISAELMTRMCRETGDGK